MRAALLLLVLLLGAPRPASAQGVPLGEFVEQVAWLWNMGDVAALVDLLPARERVVLDTGRGTEAVTAHHAGAALRALFDGRESLGVRSVRTSVAGRTPPRGFGELQWSYRVRGGPSAQSRSVYIGAVWEGRGWRINELRLMP